MAQFAGVIYGRGQFVGFVRVSQGQETHDCSLLLCVQLLHLLSKFNFIKKFALEYGLCTNIHKSQVYRSSRRGATETDPTRNHEVQSPASLSRLRIQRCVAVSCGVGHRRSSDLALPWLWHRLAAAAPIGPYPGNLHMPGFGPKKDKRQKKKKSA